MVKEYVTKYHIVCVDERGNRFMVMPKPREGFTDVIEEGTIRGFRPRRFEGPVRRVPPCYTFGVWLRFNEEGNLSVCEDQVITI
jgi:hypothetical protein